MPYATTPDKVRLYYEEVGQGTPILFVHEFAADHRSWEPQLRAFGKRYRCITYAARGYKPSDVPSDPAVYTYRQVMGDAVTVLDHLQDRHARTSSAYRWAATPFAGGAQSSGARVARWFSPAPAPAASAGTPKNFTSGRAPLAAQFEREGSAAVAQIIRAWPEPHAVRAQGSARLRRSSSRNSAEHDPQGSAHMSRGFQGARPSLYDFESEHTEIDDANVDRGWR